MAVTIKTPDEIEKMRVAGRLAADQVVVAPEGPAAQKEDPGSVATGGAPCRIEADDVALDRDRIDLDVPFLPSWEADV